MIFSFFLTSSQREKSKPLLLPEDAAESEQEQATEPPQASEADAQDSEQQQANEQWLKRIPDDPSGLLKRKFLYQYSRQKQRNNSGQQW